MDTVEALHMPYKLLKEITGGFSGEYHIGSGTFGTVYKGRGKYGQEIAVKLLRDLDIDGNGFRREFNNLIKLKHPNIVRLVGFCSEDEEVIAQYHGRSVTAIWMHRALCFEYMNNGSLQKHLHGEHEGLDWQTRYTIIKGICRGLKYLHMELKSPIYHLDLKPDNILLDNQMVPKIADFGISRIIAGEDTIRTLSAVGTMGYWPPEFFENQIISKEFDIFSLGVIIIKIICGPERYYSLSDVSPTEFIGHVHTKRRDRLQAMPSLEEDCQQVMRCLEIAFKCVDKDKRRRPNIGFIINELIETERNKNVTTSLMDQYLGLEAGNLKLKYLKMITKNFSNEQEIGKGGYGTVYKGVDDVNGKVIAVKKFNFQANFDDMQFVNEAMLLSALSHPNIVKIEGYCKETELKMVSYEREKCLVTDIYVLLCLEYLPNGSLEKYLSVVPSVKRQFAVPN